MAKMKTTTKVLIGAVVLAGAGVAGYFGYKKYKESAIQNQTTTAGLGAFVDGGYADYNATVAHRYWRRMNQMQHERLRSQSLRGY